MPVTNNVHIALSERQALAPVTNNVHIALSERQALAPVTNNVHIALSERQALAPAARALQTRVGGATAPSRPPRCFCTAPARRGGGAAGAWAGGGVP
jgi:hypothetical protein